MYKAAAKILIKLGANLDKLKLKTTLENVAVQCEELVKTLKSGGSLRDIDVFLTKVSGQINRALDASQNGQPQEPFFSA